jgi:hypothetical protein
MYQLSNTLANLRLKCAQPSSDRLLPSIAKAKICGDSHSTDGVLCAENRTTNGFPSTPTGLAIQPLLTATKPTSGKKLALDSQMA